MGDAAIEFNPGKAPSALPRDRVIIGTQAAGLTDLAAALGDRADSVLLGAQQIVNKRTADELYATLNALQGTLKAAERTMQVLSDPAPGRRPSSPKTMVTLRALSTRLDSTLANPASHAPSGATDTLTGNLAA